MREAGEPACSIPDPLPPLRPLCIDLFCGMFGWSRPWLNLGGAVVGVDISHEPYHGPVPDGADLILQDVHSLHGRQLKDASLILASPPCTEYSYMAMPWTRAKQIARALRGADVFPDGYTGSRTTAELTALFDACFRIQREACEASGRFIPLVVENVVGAQKWVGRAKWRYGSFYLWGDVPALMPTTFKGSKAAGLNWSNYTGTPGYPGGQAFNDPAFAATKNSGGSWFNIGSPGQKNVNQNPVHRATSGDWFNGTGPGLLRSHGSKSSARRAASARIAKIPEALAAHICETYFPTTPRTDP